MGLAAPWFLAGLLAVALPVWLHLLRKHTSDPVPFSSLMFFEQRTQSSIRRRRLHYLLLFALRAALLALLALAFAGPFLKGRPAAADGRRMLVLALDESFSMRQGDRMGRARREAEAALSRLRGGQAQVIAFSSRTRLLAGPTNDLGALRAAIASVEPGDGQGSLAEFCRAVRSLASSSRQPLEVHLFSDFQRASLPQSFTDLELPPGARVELHSIADSPAANWTVESVTAPRRLHGDRRGRIQAVIAGFGTAAATLPVSLVVGGKALETKQVPVSAGGRASVEFLSLEAPYGLAKGEIRIDAGDAFPDDDRRLFAVERSEPRRALFLRELNDTRSPLYYRAALESAAAGEFTLEDIPASQSPRLPPARYAFIVLSNAMSLPRAAEAEIEKYVKDGGSLLIALGPSSAARGAIPVFGGSVLESHYASRDGRRFLTAARLDAAHPALSRAGGWEAVRFYQIFRVDESGASVLARAADETPLLLEKRAGAGRVLVFASTFDNISNDFPLHTAFVPFVGQSALYLAGLDDRSSSLPVDSYLALRAGREQRTSVEVIGPDGRRALDLSEAATAPALLLSQRGFYEVRRGNGRNELVAVNPDRNESDLEPAPKETLSLWAKNTGPAGAGPGASGVTASESRSLWWPLLAAAMLLAVAESLVGRRYLTPREQGP
jgi:hypothetical protein